MKRFGLFILDNWIWLIIVILGISVFFAFHVPHLTIEEDETTWFSKNDPVLKKYHEFEDVFITNETAIIAYTTDNALSGKELKYLSKLSGELKKIPNVIDVISLTTVDDIIGTDDGLEIKRLIYKNNFSNQTGMVIKERIDLNPFFKGVLVSDDYRSFGIVLQIEWSREEEQAASDVSREITEGIKEILQKESVENGRRFYLGGGIITDSEVSTMIEKDMYRFFPISILLTSVIFLLIFRNIIAVIFPVISVTLALLWTLGLKGITDSPITPVSTTLFALITVIGIANSVHLISHFNIEILRLGNKRQALLETFERAGSACLYTSLTTALGFGSLSVSRMPVIRDMGIFAAFGIMCAFLLSIILVSVGIMFSNTGERSPGKQEIPALKNLLNKITNINLNYPRWVLIVSMGVTVIMVLGIPRIKVESSMLKYLKKGCLLRKDAEFLDSALVGISSVEVMIKGEQDSFKEPENLRKIEKLQRLVEKHAEVSASHSMVDYIKLIYRALNSDSSRYFCIPETREAVAQSLLLYEISGGSDIEDYITTTYDIARVSVGTRQMSQDKRTALLDEISTYLGSHFSNMTFEITGFDNLVHKATERIVSTQIRSLGLAIIIIIVLMCLIFGFRGGLISILPNIFPIVFLLGLMGYAGFRLNIATAIIASIAIGVVVDDTIHYFFHYRHELKRTGNREQAMINAHLNVGSALCYTSIILALGFLIFLMSETRILIDYGMLSCIAVVAALFGDLFIGPVLLLKLKVFN